MHENNKCEHIQKFDARLVIQVVPRAGFCMETDSVTPLSLGDAAHASLEHHPDTKPLCWIFWVIERGSVLSCLFHSFTFYALFLHHLFLLLSFLPFSPLSAPHTSSYHLLLLLPFLLTKLQFSRQCTRLPRWSQKFNPWHQLPFFFFKDIFAIMRFLRLVGPVDQCAVYKQALTRCGKMRKN